MNYEIQSAIEKKADNWKVNELERELDGLKSECRNQSNEIDRLKSSLSNQTYLIGNLLNFLLESGKFEEHENEIHQLKNQL